MGSSAFCTDHECRTYRFASSTTWRPSSVLDSTIATGLELTPEGAQEGRPHHGAADRFTERVLDDVVDEGEVRRLDAEARERSDWGRAQPFGARRMQAERLARHDVDPAAAPRVRAPGIRADGEVVVALAVPAAAGIDQRACEGSVDGREEDRPDRVVRREDRVRPFVVVVGLAPCPE